MALFAQTLMDESVAVAGRTVVATAALVPHFEPEHTAMFGQLMDPILNTVCRCLQEGEDQLASDSLDIFERCLTDAEYPLLKHVLPNIVETLLQIGLSEEVDAAIKTKLWWILQLLAETHPKSLVKMGLLGPVLQASLQVLTAGSLLDSGQEAEEELEEESSSTAFVEDVITSLSTSIPSELLLPLMVRPQPAGELAGSGLTAVPNPPPDAAPSTPPQLSATVPASTSESDKERYAALVATAAVIKGCSYAVQTSEYEPLQSGPTAAASPWP